MNTCPHCQFLLADGATTCSVCHRDVTAPPAMAATASGFAAPGTPPSPGYGPAGTVPPPPAWGTAVPGGAVPGQGAPAWQPATRKKTSTAKVLLILGGVVVLLAGLAFAALTGLAALDGRPEIATGDLNWNEYRQAEGHFQVDLPGEGVESTVEIPTAFGKKADIKVINVAGSDFAASVWTYPEFVSPGLTFADMPFSPDAAARGAAGNGFKDGKIISNKIVEGTGNTQMAIEMPGTVAGQDAIMLSRLIIVGTNMFEVTASGPTEHRESLLDAQARMTASFKAPAA